MKIAYIVTSIKQNNLVVAVLMVAILKVILRERKMGEMKHFTSEEKFQAIKRISDGSTVGIHNFGMLHEIGEALDMKNNSGAYLRSLNQRITKIMRDLIKEGYPIKEYRIKCCSWTEKETWHACFKIEQAHPTEKGGAE